MARKKPKKNRRSLGLTKTNQVRLAQQLWSRGDFDESLKAFASAVRNDRSNIGLLLDAARAHGVRYAPEKCTAYLQRATSLASRNPDVHFVAGEVYRTIGHFDSAEQSFKRATFLAQSAPRAELELANLCERSHRIDEGFEYINRVIARWPDSASATIIKARLLRRSGEVSESESLLRRMLDQPKCKPSIQAEAWGELAALLDREGQFEAAWDAIQNCKNLQLANDGAERRAAEHVGARFGRLVDEINTAAVQRWSRSCEDHSPVCLLTGFPRSGTTLLEQILDAHSMLVSGEEQDMLSSAIFPSLGPSDPNYPIVKLLDEVTDASILNHRRGYFEFMAAAIREPIGQRMLIDKNPAMTPMIPVFRRLFQDSKIIMALRDPRDVLASCYLRYLPLNPVSVCFLTPERTAQRLCEDLAAWHRFRELYDNWFEVRYEQVVADYQQVASQAVDFLGYEWSESLEDYRARTATKVVRSPTYEAVTRPIYNSSIGRWRNYASKMEVALKKLDQVVETFGYDR